MKVIRFSALVLALTLLIALGGAAGAQEPQVLASGGCVAGGTYDPACDVDHNGEINIIDLELVAGHWRHAGTWTSDNNHNHLGQTWTGSNNPLVINGGFSSAPLKLNNDTGDGLRVESAGSSGVWVSYAHQAGLVVDYAGTYGTLVGSANADGIRVNSAGSDGVFINRVGNPTSTNTSSRKNGFEVGGAEGSGVFIGRADHDGVAVNDAGRIGVVVGSTTDDGFHVNNAGDDGIGISGANNHGLYVFFAGNDGVHVYSANNYAGYFNGSVRITGTCTGCTLAGFGRNAGQTPLEPGDVVAVRGITQTELQHTPVVMDVDRPSGSDAVIGVVAGRAELEKDEEGEGREAVQRLVPREGPAQPGEYVNIVIYGLAQVKASAVDTPIQPGTRLTASKHPGDARAVRTVEVQGVQVAESTSILGTALEGLESGEGLIWVLVNPR